jgi:hypothetical protein
MKLDKNTFPTNMNMVEVNGKKVLVRPSHAESTKGKEVVIDEERQPRKIRTKNLEIGHWKKNERSYPRCHPKVTFDILMAKYRDGRTSIRGHENRTIQFPWIRLVLLRREARPTNNPGHCCGKIQKVRIIIDCIPSTLHQFLIQWITNEIEVVHVEASAYTALTNTTADW